MKPLVIYHGNCADGFTAAWAIWKAHPDWEFLAARYGDAPPDTECRRIYLVDFSYKRPVLLELASGRGNLITILDHHKTAQEALIDLPCTIDVVFNMEKSGARLAWEYFHPLEDVPKIVTFVEDRDLWLFKHQETRPVSAYIFSYDYTFENWTNIAQKIEYNMDNVIQQGEAIERQHIKDVNELAINYFRANIAGYNVPVINVPYTLASDMCHKLAINEPFAASFYYDGQRQKFIFSLRSTEDGVDVSAIAKQLGGGGHQHAAGYEVATGPLQLGLGEGI